MFNNTRLEKLSQEFYQSGDIYQNVRYGALSEWAKFQTDIEAVSFLNRF